MNYIYIPDSYNEKEIRNKFKDREYFIKLQARYRKFFEKILEDSIHFSNI